MNLTHIEWTDFSSNPLIYRRDDGTVVWACVKKSRGCVHCYAEALAKRYGRGAAFTAAEMAKLTPDLNLREVWAILSKQHIKGTLVAGSRVFIEDMSDLFGEWVPDVLLDRLMAVFALRRDVTFQLLTKRIDRARRYFDVMGSDSDEYRDRWDAARAWLRQLLLNQREPASMGRPEYVGMIMAHQTWPLPNVDVGTSIEDTPTARERLPELVATKAARRWVSYEPALDAVDFERVLWNSGIPEDVAMRHAIRADDKFVTLKPIFGINLIVVGGESGAGASPFNPGWARLVVEQGARSGVCVFVKQYGSKPIAPTGRSFETFVTWAKASTWLQSGDVCIDQLGRLCARGADFQRARDANAFPVDIYRPQRLRSYKGGDPDEWAPDLRVRELPEVRA